jgi:hypothetical protein
VFARALEEGAHSVLDTVFGLPTHVLVVHAVVLGVPVAAAATIAIALRPAWRHAVGWWVVGLDAAALVVTVIARQSGTWFFRRLGEPEAAVEHTSLGLSLVWFVLVLLAAAIMLALADRLPGGWTGHAAATLAIVAALVTVVQVVRTGHSGTAAVWRAVVESTEPGGG